MARKKNLARNVARQKRLRPLAGLLAVGLTAPAFTEQSVPYPTYVTGPQTDGSYIVSSGQRITPAGVQVGLGIRVRAKAIALNPNPASHTAAVLTLGASEAVEVFDTHTGMVLQTYSPFGDSSGSYSGISYSADGKYLMFSQDSSNVAIARVASNGLLSDDAHVPVPPNNSFVKCFPNSPIGDYAAPCGTFYTTSTSYPGGVAFSEDGKSAYALLNQNNTVARLDLTTPTPTQGTQIRVGNAPHSILIKGQTAYISNEGGREAQQRDFQVLSAGTPIVADPVNGSAITGTVSVVDLRAMQVVDTISNGIGLHPTGMAFFGDALLVANTYSDTISVIDTATNKVMRTIDLGLPIKAPGEKHAAYGAGPNSIAVDNKAGVAYVALYNANAVAVVDLSGSAHEPVLGMIPVAYAPSSVVLDQADRELLVANDKGIGTRLSFETDHGVTGYNSHQDNGTVSIVPLPNRETLESMTRQVYQNNHWDLRRNIVTAAGGDHDERAVPIPERIGDPSLIKHVFLIIRENRTYDQVLGDVPAGNGDPSLAVFGGADTPNMHDIIKRFPLLDNFYTPSRQSADGHQWIVEAMAPYADDIQSPDWVRSYPGGNAGDALAYQKKGFLFQEAVAKGLSVKIYGEYVENEFFPTSQGHPTWSQFFADSQKFEAGKEPTLTYQNAINVESSVPVVSQHLIKNFPQFDLNIPDQFRVDLWVQDFNKDLKAGTVPALSILWVMDDHTGGPPTADAEQADNDLALGRIIDYISHSNVWKSSAIFVEEDDSQNGVDHVDGHRSPGYVISPYAVQHGPTDHTYYTQVNMTRTIEQILGLPPMNQFDLVASPMRTAFLDHGLEDRDDVAKQYFQPFNHLPNQIPLDKGVTPATASLSTMAKSWRKAKIQIFAGKSTRPDSEDPDTVNHLAWYEATNFKRPYPGETKVRPPSDFVNLLTTNKDEDGD
jgi:YVTN family beta-propeller protein